MNSWSTSLLKESTSHLIRNQRLLNPRASVNETKSESQRRKRNGRRPVIGHVGCRTPTWLYQPRMKTSLIWLSLTLIPAVAHRLMNRSQINSIIGSKCANSNQRNFKCGRTKTNAATVQDGMKPRSVRSPVKIDSNNTIACAISLQPHPTDIMTTEVFITGREEEITNKVTAMAKSTETGTMLTIMLNAQTTRPSGMIIITKRLPTITLNPLSKADKMLSTANTMLTRAHSSHIRTKIINRATERSFLITITMWVRNSKRLKSRTSKLPRKMDTEKWPKM